ncbi:MAG: hypothetical protein RQ952_06850 [Thermoproteota archaeon]|jgi:hypothetical protein|nr:hypothetical protein [Thermoproteota archaeon]
MIPIFWPINISLAMINLVLSAWILSIVLKNRKLIKSKTTNYLSAFAGMMVLANIFAIAIYFHFSLYYGPEIAIPLIPLNMAIFFSIIFLIWVLKD